MRDRYDLGLEISELLCSSIEPLEDIKYLFDVLKKQGSLVLRKENADFNFQVKQIEVMVNRFG